MFMFYLIAESISFFPADQHEASISCTYIFDHICDFFTSLLHSYALCKTTVSFEKEKFLAIEFCRRKKTKS